MKPLVFLRKNLSLFKYSLTKSEFLHSYGLDILAVALLFGLSFGFLTPIQHSLDTLQELLPTVVEADNVAPSVIQTLESTYVRIAVLFVIYLILSVMVVSATRLFIWRRLAKSKAPSELLMRRFGRYVVHFLMTVLGIVVFIGIPLLLIIASTKNVQTLTPEKIQSFAILLATTTLLFMHLYLVFNRVYARSSKAWVSVTKAFSIGLLRINYFILPYVLGFLLLIIVSLIGLLFRSIFPSQVFTVLYVLVFTAYLSVMRLYLNKLIAVVHKKFYK